MPVPVLMAVDTYGSRQVDAKAVRLAAWFHDAVYDEFVRRFVERVAALRTGDPLDESTEVGPMIDEANAIRAEDWVREAVAAGATLATGGMRRGSILEPVVLLETTPAMRVNCEEVFAPVTTVRRYRSTDEALAPERGLSHEPRIAIYTRTMDRTDESFPEIVAAAQSLPGDWLLDGEIVPYDDESAAVLPFAILPAMFAGAFPGLDRLNVMRLASPGGTHRRVRLLMRRLREPELEQPRAGGPATAKLWVAAGRAQGVRRRAKVVGSRAFDGEPGDVLEIELKFPDSAAGWIAGFGPDVVVLEPELLAKTVREKLLGALRGAGVRA
mgnify:CR=1 FL=1